MKTKTISGRAAPQMRAGMNLKPTPASFSITPLRASIRSGASVTMNASGVSSSNWSTNPIQTKANYANFSTAGPVQTGNIYKIGGEMTMNADTKNWGQMQMPQQSTFSAGDFAQNMQDMAL